MIQVLHKGALHRSCGEGKAVRRRHARLVASLTPANAELGHEFFRLVHLFQESAETEFRGTESGAQQCWAFVASNCRPHQSLVG